ncbi:hypothetical protein T03_7510 [Trichinella britovi]|uniref:Uncharacterized protein n=1 Tax=Trichinella britovi TaxID=45882 RepID=A0A0V1D353_TRIBR|nr:hypothetical protein T03_7510 [Trichinella britovi]
MENPFDIRRIYEYLMFAIRIFRQSCNLVKTDTYKLLKEAPVREVFSNNNIILSFFTDYQIREIGKFLKNVNDDHHFITFIPLIYSCIRLEC